MPITDKVTEVRTRIEALKNERSVVWTQARSREEVRQCVHDQTIRWEEQAQAQIRLELRRLAAGHTAIKLIDGDIANWEVALARVLTGVLGAEAIERVLLRPLEDAVPEGMSTDRRNARLFEIDEELTALEIREEALIEESEEAGSPITRRGDARPEIVVGEREPRPVALPRSPHYMARERRRRAAIAPSRGFARAASNRSPRRPAARP